MEWRDEDGRITLGLGIYFGLYSWWDCFVVLCWFCLVGEKVFVVYCTYLFAHTYAFFNFSLLD